MEQKELEHQEQVRGVHDEPEDQITPRHLNYLKCVLISQLLLEANDELKGSVGFKQNVKLQVNKTSKLLEGIYQEGFNTVYGNNPEMCTNVLNKIDSLIKQKALTRLLQRTRTRGATSADVLVKRFRGRVE